MIILSKNKQTLKIDEFKFKCCIGKNGLSLNKKEGDKKTPKGLFSIGDLYLDQIELKAQNKFKKIIIKKIWVGVMYVNYPKYYNKLIKTNNNINMKNFIEKITNIIYLF